MDCPIPTHFDLIRGGYDPVSKSSSGFWVVVCSCAGRGTQMHFDNTSVGYHQPPSLSGHVGPGFARVESPGCTIKPPHRPSLVWDLGLW